MVLHGANGNTGRGRNIADAKRLGPPCRNELEHRVENPIHVAAHTCPFSYR
jgi:hypothetical protein